MYGRDGSQFNRTTHRQVAFVVIHESISGSSVTNPEERVLISADSIARHSFITGENDKVIRVRVILTPL